MTIRVLSTNVSKWFPDEFHSASYEKSAITRSMPTEFVNLREKYYGGRGRGGSFESRLAVFFSYGYNLVVLLLFFQLFVYVDRVKRIRIFFRDTLIVRWRRGVRQEAERVPVIIISKSFTVIFGRYRSKRVFWIPVYTTFYWFTLGIKPSLSFFFLSKILTTIQNQFCRLHWNPTRFIVFLAILCMRYV